MNRLEKCKNTSERKKSFIIDIVGPHSILYILRCIVASL